MRDKERAAFVAEYARRFPLWFGVQGTLAFLGGFLLVERIGELFRAGASPWPLLEVLVPAVAGAIALTWFLRRPSRARAT